MTFQRWAAGFIDSLYMWCRVCGCDIPLKDGCAHIAPWNDPRRRRKPVRQLATQPEGCGVTNMDDQSAVGTWDRYKTTEPDLCETARASVRFFAERKAAEAGQTIDEWIDATYPPEHRAFMRSQLATQPEGRRVRQ